MVPRHDVHIDAPWKPGVFHSHPTNEKNVHKWELFMSGSYASYVPKPDLDSNIDLFLAELQQLSQEPFITND